MIVLDLPPGIPVNRTRRMNWAAKPRIKAWMRSADNLVRSQGKLPKAITGRYEAMLVLSENTRSDADATIKMILDYARRLELVTDDSPKYLRRVVIEFGEAPEGCRLILREWVEPAQKVEGFVTVGDAARGVVSRLASKTQET